ncbi:type II toxin-antitoxin system HigB family toxin [Dyadobacter sediminis]|uniref:Type II toxin-antitoxin system HigB family toxin n=1 Tax=Dyadobacter sediminis TaxID=1493691 RepID=A0A5R9KA68_9BACT|nr:type II toxin-antitoxin system HigB family toxin [Dyadobacter sediminis]TLU91617.1 type II toxin-antitoxin system HigB family toxin [Dyadobacter sediminis]GGC01857.1 hypothetical protein GCM10011325_31250 [Dyadobacter sediminis]
MLIEGTRILIKLKLKNQGNTKLTKAIENLIADFESIECISTENFQTLRKDADKVHSNGIYFLNIHHHRVLVLIEFEENEATVLWAGSHDEYVSIFKNNKRSIEKWLKSNNILK